MKFLLSHVVFLFIVLIIQRSVFASNDLITKTCMQTPYKELCVTTLKSDGRSQSATDVSMLAQIMVDVLSAKASYAFKHVNELLKEAKSAELRKALQNCHDNYNAVVIGDIPQAKAGVKLGNPKFAEEATMDCATEAESCENGFTSGGSSSPISEMNKEFKHLSVVAASIMHLLL